jgi:hypothetical protein
VSEERVNYETKDNELVFTATLPQIQSAMSFGGDGEVRIKLDIPASDRPAALRLAELGPGKLLRMAVRIDEP